MGHTPPLCQHPHLSCLYRPCCGHPLAPFSPCSPLLLLLPEQRKLALASSPARCWPAAGEAQRFYVKLWDTPRCCSHGEHMVVALPIALRVPPPAARWPAGVVVSVSNQMAALVEPCPRPDLLFLLLHPTLKCLLSWPHPLGPPASRTASHAGVHLVATGCRLAVHPGGTFLCLFSCPLLPRHNVHITVPG